MSQVVVDGYLGGKLFVDGQGQVTAFFCERFVTGCPCDVALGPILGDLLSLEADEHLDRRIEGIEDIYAREAPPSLHLEQPEVVLYVLSSYRHSTNMLIVSQEKLRTAARWALVPM